MLTIKVNVIVQQEEAWFIAKCVENSVVSANISNHFGGRNIMGSKYPVLPPEKVIKVPTKNGFV